MSPHAHPNQCRIAYDVCTNSTYGRCGGKNSFGTKLILPAATLSPEDSGDDKQGKRFCFNFLDVFLPLLLAQNKPCSLSKVRASAV